jgi:hypothetical protein
MVMVSMAVMHKYMHQRARQQKQQWERTHHVCQMFGQ